MVAQNELGRRGSALSIRWFSRTRGHADSALLKTEIAMSLFPVRVISSSADVEALQALVRDNRIASLLEFGPGHSTHYFLSAGVERITTCENDPAIFRSAREFFRSEDRVSVLHYVFSQEIHIPKLDGKAFDAAYVNAPDGDRMNTLRAALRACGLVFVQDAKRPDRMAALERITDEGFAYCEMIDTEKGLAAVYRMKRLPPVAIET
jgi:predicted O-methyltransferase YrrM